MERWIVSVIICATSLLTRAEESPGNLEEFFPSNNKVHQLQKWLRGRLVMGEYTASTFPEPSRTDFSGKTYLDLPTNDKYTYLPSGSEEGEEEIRYRNKEIQFQNEDLGEISKKILVSERGRDQYYASSDRYVLLSPLVEEYAKASRRLNIDIRYPNGGLRVLQVPSSVTGYFKQKILNDISSELREMWNYPQRKKDNFSKGWSSLRDPHGSYSHTPVGRITKYVPVFPHNTQYVNSQPNLQRIVILSPQVETSSQKGFYGDKEQMELKSKGKRIQPRSWFDDGHLSLGPDQDRLTRRMFPLIKEEERNNDNINSTYL